MRIANTHSLPLMPNPEVSIDLGREVLQLCLEEFKWYASRGKSLKLQLSAFDVYVIGMLYPDKDAGLDLKLANVIEDIFSKVEIPFLLFPIIQADPSRMIFRARVSHLKR